MVVVRRIQEVRVVEVVGCLHRVTLARVCEVKSVAPGDVSVAVVCKRQHLLGLRVDLEAVLTVVAKVGINRGRHEHGIQLEVDLEVRGLIET